MARFLHHNYTMVHFCMGLLPISLPCAVEPLKILKGYFMYAQPGNVVIKNHKYRIFTEVIKGFKI